MKTPFEIPAAMREFTETSMNQARKAFDDYLAAAQKATQKFDESEAASKDSVQRMQEETLAFAEANVTASLELAQRLVRARDIQEMARIQQDYIKQQMAALADQSRRMTEIARSAARDSGKRG